MGALSVRILEAVLSCATNRGINHVSLKQIAAFPGVRKGLALYHFRDKTTLLASALNRVSCQMSGREASAINSVSREQLRVINELTHAEGDNVSPSARATDRNHRATTNQTNRRISTELGLQPRVPIGLITEVWIASVGGLAVYRRERADKHTGKLNQERPAYDVLLLALLSLVH
ncbi:MAG: hypothetical protein NVS4B2_05780 [Chloroflexota bacterium]